MRARYRKLFFAGVCLLGLLAACSRDETPAPAARASKLAGPVKIGVVGPATGDESHYGLSVLAGAQAAAKRINAQGGIGGQPLEIVAFDDASKIEQAIRGVQDLLAAKVAAIVAAPTGSSTFAPIHLVTDAKVLFVSVGSRRHLKASGPYVFRLAVPDEAATEDLVAHAVKALGYQRFALVTAADNDDSLDLSAHFFRALSKHGATVVARADTYDTLTGKHQLGPVVAALKSAEPAQAILFTGSAREAVELAQALRKAGVKAPLLGGEELHSAEFLAGGEAVAEALVYASFAPEVKSEGLARLQQDLGQTAPDRFSALAYDTILLLAAAIGEAGTTDAGPVREALIRRQDFVGSTGSTGFSADNLPRKHPYLFRVENAPGAQARFVLQTASPAN